MRSLRIQTKILLGGLALASLILVFGQARLYVLERDLNSIVQRCELVIGRASFGCELDAWAGIRPVGLSASQQAEFANMRAEFANTQTLILSSRNSTKKISLAVLFLALIPWLWYFLLKRIREISDAIFGR